MKVYNCILNDATKRWDIVDCSLHHDYDDYPVIKEGFETKEECQKYIDELRKTK